ncbi:hypothetical protein OHB39_29175 [Streptomyces sp. NBC_00047]|uniref:hypothetical protein n=1 Tax=Streptomyces sp. NBC_00047 TaxID=2975627 RepID=UPI00224D3A4E|nr:hypothetical protein [Streptomyces sp. NBC_00047]MCX5611596.1 hypothetical protein [Streptomyces sp. NBC_00047]
MAGNTASPPTLSVNVKPQSVIVVVGIIGGIIAAIAAAPEAIDAIDTLGERSIAGEIDNGLNQALTKSSEEHESGRFTDSKPPASISPMSHGLFGSRNSFPGEGTVGNVVYRADDGTTFICDWSVPFIGANSAGVTIGGTHRGRYAAQAVSNAGNTSVHMSWVVVQLGPPFIVNKLLDIGSVIPSGSGSLRKLLNL